MVVEGQKAGEHKRLNRTVVDTEQIDHEYSGYGFEYDRKDIG